MDYNNLWYVPVAHAFLYGVVKNFWSLVLRPTKDYPPTVADNWYVATPESRRKMSAAATEAVRTRDLTSPYSDVVHNRGLWTMEDWKAFTEVRCMDACKGFYKIVACGILRTSIA